MLLQYYAHSFQKAYSHVLWVTADSPASLVTGFVELAHDLDLPEKDEKDQGKIVQAMQRWLREYLNWLLILDNIEDLSLVSSFIPAGHLGSVLVTTRRQVTEPVAQAVVLDVLSEDMSALLLLKRSKRLALDTSLVEAPDSEVVVARTITRHLGGLPLALDQAGAYIAENRCSLSHYLDLLTREQQRLLQRRGTVSSDHPQSVTATFSLAFEQIRQKNTAASDLLNVCAFLAPDAIPLDMITEGAAHLGPILATVAVDALQFDQSLERLQTYSLVRRDGENRTLSIHRLVQAVLKDKLEEAEKLLWAERAMLAVNTAFPRVEHGTWSQCERLLPHALRIAQHIETYRIVGEEAGCLLHETATYLRDRARYPEAEPLFQRALRIREQHLGPEHPDVATTLTGLANLYRMQGKYVEAEPLFQQAIGINEQQPWPKHSEVAYPLNSLAILYQEQGKYAEAEPLYLRALAVWEQQLGLDHPLVAHPLNGLAELYFEQEKYAEAEPLYLRALRIREQSLGFQHPDTAETMHDLARLQDTQGNSEEARDWYVRALAVREQALGGHHPKTTETRMHLTALRHAMVQNEEATQLEAPHSEQRKRTSEEDHPEE